MPKQKTDATAHGSPISILQEMIAIDSVNPSLDETARGEAALADYIEDRCRRAGLHTSRQAVLPGRDNLLIELRTGKRDTLLLEAHMDTVPLTGMAQALVPTIREGRLYGRGACDTKGSLAAMLFAVEHAARNPQSLACDVLLCCTVDEEYGMRGMRRFVEQAGPIAGAVVGEPTDLQIVSAHKGCAWFAIETRGKAAHSSVPDAGNSAITQMLEVLRFIQERIEPRLTSQHHALCGSPTLVVGTIQGGTQPNIVPEKCEIQIDRRVVPGEDTREVLNEFVQLLNGNDLGRGVDAKVRELSMLQPLNTAPEAAIVQCAQSAAQALALNSQLTGVPFGSHASTLQHSGHIPSIVFGPGSIALAHSAQENVPLEEVEQAVQFYGELMRTFAISL